MTDRNACWKRHRKDSFLRGPGSNHRSVAARSLERWLEVQTPASNEPPRYARAVGLPLSAKFASRPRFFKQNNAKVEPAQEKHGVDDQRARIPEQAPPNENNDNPNVHRISREPIRSSGYQVLRWVPGCQSTASRHVEFAHAPQQQKQPKTERHCRQCCVPHRKACRDPNRDGQDKADHPRQSDKSRDGADEHLTSNHEVERRAVAPAPIGADSSRSPTHSSSLRKTRSRDR
jgi:hypothetical protein